MTSELDRMTEQTRTIQIGDQYQQGAYVYHVVDVGTKYALVKNQNSNNYDMPYAKRLDTLRKLKRIV